MNEPFDTLMRNMTGFGLGGLQGQQQQRAFDQFGLQQQFGQFGLGLQQLPPSAEQLLLNQKIHAQHMESVHQEYIRECRAAKHAEAIKAIAKARFWLRWKPRLQEGFQLVAVYAFAIWANWDKF